MKKYLLIIILIFPVFIIANPLRFKDINPVMDRIFEYHIEYKKYDETIVSRSLKIYIDQFDSLKIYLLENEVDEYLNVKKNKVKNILNNIRNNDFSDYIKLNEIFQNAVLRARKNRDQINKALILNDISLDKIKGSYTSFAATDNELLDRQKNSIVGFYLSQKKRSKIDAKEKRQKVINLLERKLTRSEARYLEELDEHLSSQHILKAFSRSLDAHSCVFSQEEADQIRLSLEKEFEGVGLVFSESIDGVIVVDMIDNSPAKNSQVIKINDILTEINGKPVEYLGFDQVMKLMKEEDSYMVLGFKRILDDDDIAFWKVKLEKRPIAMNDQRLTYTYESFADGIIGKLDLNSFYENSTGITSEKDLKSAIRNLRKIGNLKGLILDLRENAGGFLSQAIKVTSLFIKSGVVVISKNSQKEIRYLRNIEGEAFYNGPLIILTSKLSASASEIVAAALQDYGVALIVGDQSTFGKGSIQYQTVTDKKADFFFKVTVGKYYTVSGKTTQIEGVKADIIVPSNFSIYKIGEKYLQYPLKADKIQDAYNDKLSDIDIRIKSWFRQNYLPNLQKKVSFWQKITPKLKENSEYRLSKDPNFQNFLKKQNLIKAKIDGEEVDIDFDDFGPDDLQMQEATNILKDMIFIETDLRKAAGL